MTDQQQSPQTERKDDDVLIRLAGNFQRILGDIAAERKRLKVVQNPTTERAFAEIHGTVLDLLEEGVGNIHELSRNILEMRQWMFDTMTSLSDTVDAHETRIDLVEDLGGGTALVPEDAEVIKKTAQGLKYLATSLLTGPFPIYERDEDGKQKLAELIAYADQVEKIVEESTLTQEDDDDEDDADDNDQDNGSSLS